MKQIQPQLPLTEFCFVFKAQDKIKIPPFPGKLLHGAFGNALYKSNCRVPGANCKKCLFKKRCAYATLFKSQYVLSSGSIKDLNNVPSPHVFQFDNQGFIYIDKHQEFTIKQIIIGNGLEYVAELFDAMKLLGNKGLYNKQLNLLIKKQINQNKLPKIITTLDDVAPAEELHIPDMPKKIRIDFVTPYIQSADKKSFDHTFWIMRLVQRISTLQRVYTEVNNAIDPQYFKDLKAQAQKLELSMQQVSFYKSLIAQKNHSAGFLGSFELVMNEGEALWPWLYIGQWTNVGKKASHGFGRYEIAVM